MNNAVFLLTGLLYMACSGCFITESRNTSPGMMAPGECLPDGSQRGISSIEVPLPVICLACVKLTHKNSQYNNSFSIYIYSIKYGESSDFLKIRFSARLHNLPLSNNVK